MRDIIIRRIEENPIIAAVQKKEDLELAIMSEVTTIFLLHADIFNIQSYVNKIKNANKSVLVHMDLLEGIAKDPKAIEYIAKIIRPDGIISTKSSHIKIAKEKGLFTVQRFFLIDNQSYDVAIRSIKTIQPDMIEVMPGVIPNVIKRIKKQVSASIIAGGLIDSKKDIIEILKSGGLGVSTGKKELWKL